MKNLLYYTQIKENDRLLDALSDYSTLFPVEIQKRWGWHLDFDDKINSIVSKLLLYKALRQIFPDATPLSHRLEYHSSGRPSIAGADFDFNISHSHHMVGCVVNFDGRIGIDIQYKKQNRNFFRFKKALKGLSNDHPIEDLNDWTALEAKVKCAGLGLKDMKAVLQQARQYILKSIDINEDYLCCIATHQPIQLSIQEVSQEELLQTIQEQFSSLKQKECYENYSLSHA